MSRNLDGLQIYINDDVLGLAVRRALRALINAKQSALSAAAAE